MIEIDNFEEIGKLPKFDMEHAYVVELVLRKKDGNTQAKGNNKNRTVKSYLFQSEKQWNEAHDEIITMCKAFNCRTYISLNRKSVMNILLGLNTNINERLRQLFYHNPTRLNGMVDSAAMKAAVDSRDERLWVVDVDSQDQNDLDAALNYIQKKCNIVYPNPIVDPIVVTLPTAHGVHIITKPFNTKVFNEEYQRDGRYEKPEIKKEALTLLYVYLR